MFRLLRPCFSPTNQRSLYEKQRGVCNGCRVLLKLRHLAIDHIVARNQGGTHKLSNLQLLCASCNSVKGNRSQSYLTQRLQIRNWISRSPNVSKVSALVWTGSRWVDVFELILFIDDPESCFSGSVEGPKTRLFTSDHDFHRAWKNMRAGLRGLLDLLESREEDRRKLEDDRSWSL
ncbi:MAG: HNH endonuclease signature motif containing protein [Gammaproteobacteria bacterium]|nr:HNH endonuclease signature motif containing protein [Gammaproteobacteria bacterium]